MLESTLTTEMLRRAKTRLLKMHFESGVGHIGGNLSSLDILLSLYHSVLQPQDAFVLSKGHSAGALYVALWSVGKATDADLRSFHQEATRFSGHPPFRGIEHILFATGSLGHGLGLAAGLALGKKLKNEPGRVFCLMSDGEWNEGSCWEALIFARHQQLDNLTFIVDANGLQGFGTTQEVADLHPLRAKFQAFGLHTFDVDGHDPVAITTALNYLPTQPAPVAIVAHTTKGKGISFMENKMEWHYLPLTAALYEQALAEVNQ